jgi:KDO2-lipid IV(A) lauroyltransferase
MNTILYWLFLLLLYPVSWLPARVLFALSDVCYVFIYYVFGYRKHVVYTNLARSFPEKNYHEIRQTARQFYRYLTDLYFENIRTLSFSRKKMSRIVAIENIEAVQQYTRQGRSTMIVTAHYGNWEYYLDLTIHLNTKIVYKPQSVKAVDKLMTRLRTHYNPEGIIPMQNVSRYLLSHKNDTYDYVFIADQSPSPQSKCWVRFLNQDTLFFGGAEKLAAALDLPVLYAALQRTARGRYTIVFTPICEHAAQLPEHEITRRFAALLEQTIIRQPAFWLWTHKRWKHRRQ